MDSIAVDAPTLCGLARRDRGAIVGRRLLAARTMARRPTKDSDQKGARPARPWTKNVDPEKHRPRGSRAVERALRAVVGQLSPTGTIDEAVWGTLWETAYNIAWSFNFQTALSGYLPTAAQIRDRLESIERAANALAASLADVDDLTAAWLCGELVVPPLIGVVPPDVDVKAFLGGLDRLFGPVPEHGRTTGELKDTLIERALALADRARVVGKSFRTAYPGSNKGSARPIPDEWRNPKLSLVDACYDLIEEFFPDAIAVGPIVSTSWDYKPNDEGGPLFAELIRAVFELATGRPPDEEGDSFERQMKRVVKHRREHAARLDKWAASNPLVRRDPTDGN